MTELKYYQAIQAAYHELLAEDDDIFVMGEDVRLAQMNNTVGLLEEFGEERVIDTPISEPGFSGIGIGAAMDGKRPVVELQINSVAFLAMEQIVNQAGKIHYMSDGKVSVPVTFTIPMAGVPGQSGAQHSENHYPAFVNHGIKSVIPATPYDAKGLLRSAVYEDDPVMVHFPTKVYGRVSEVPDEPYDIPLGDADVKRTGEDVTLVCIAEAVPPALSVAEDLAGDVSVEVVDLRTALPIDTETITESVEKTGRVIIADPANRTAGLAAEITARIAERSFWSLDAPIQRVTKADVPVAFNPPQEDYVLPDAELIEAAVTDIA